ncbi:class D sortase [Paenibacillus sp. GYB006]|uniref:class D sortase n=1 Tax=Paenibacillus sp. GYB006 TaxID=2994394 RepID=UPI002F961A0C
MKVKVMYISIVVIGLFVLFYPDLSERYYDYQQQKLIQSWEESFQNIQQTEEEMDQVSETNHDEMMNTSLEDLKSAFSEYENMEGILTINKIVLKLPILQGATQENLKTTLASIENTSKAGQTGNYAIAGHRSHTYGRNFNRLDELEIGDIIDIRNEDSSFQYQVTEKLIVEPQDVWVLEGNDVDKELTLVTCDPLINPTHRLIVKAKLVE